MPTLRIHVVFVVKNLVYSDISSYPIFLKVRKVRKIGKNFQIQFSPFDVTKRFVFSLFCITKILDFMGLVVVSSAIFFSPDTASKELWVYVHNYTVYFWNVRVTCAERVTVCHYHSKTVHTFLECD